MYDLIDKQEAGVESTRYAPGKARQRLDHVSTHSDGFDHFLQYTHGGDGLDQSILIYLNEIKKGT